MDQTELSEKVGFFERENEALTSLSNTMSVPRQSILRQMLCSYLEAVTSDSEDKAKQLYWKVIELRKRYQGQPETISHD